MLITEYRIPMPLSVSEYERGQLFSIIEASKKETKKGAGVEILINEPFENYPLLGDRFTRGNYTKKVYYVANRMPKFIASLAPKSALIVYEESWNAFPYCRTILTNKKMGSNFFIQIDTYHMDMSRGEVENIHQLDADKLKKRQVVLLDIAKDKLPSDWSVPPTEEPSKFSSTKTNRGPLVGDWMETTKPIMTCYKLVTTKFKWFGLQGTIEKFIIKTEHKIFLKFHKQVFCWIDLWIDLSMPEIRRMELEAKEQLSQLLKTRSPSNITSASRSASYITSSTQQPSHQSLSSGRTPSRYRIN